MTYYLRVTNHSSQGVSFEGRYAVLGWSRAARDAEDAADAMSEGGQVSDDLLLALGDGSQSLPSADLEIDREPVSAGMANGHR